MLRGFKHRDSHSAAEIKMKRGNPKRKVLRIRHDCKEAFVGDIYTAFPDPFDLFLQFIDSSPLDFFQNRICIRHNPLTIS